MKAAPEMIEISRGRSRRSPARSHELDKQNVSRERSIAPGCRSGRRAGGAGVRVARSFSAGALADLPRTPFLTGLRSTMPRFWAPARAPLGRLA